MDLEDEAVFDKEALAREYNQFLRRLTFILEKPTPVRVWRHEHETKDIAMFKRYARIVKEGQLNGR